ncbi:hypothetical protein Dgeo_1053 [Deinococcus geothermalis DSM 11300]|uniref:Uncharacterized protein n=1 Tax=Deinococcus geothermalis (strain DSM 11300 / CIP 105573 / AG-3a) TaxID=319795 RepID=Q1IZI2_DEIGD|nr:hypothetical protein [Deinococcus geothermalis]ABF45352.1 hypothetical protein Dgeo_1053 [Deinococcus geothermalis DSM 11300]
MEALDRFAAPLADLVAAVTPVNALDFLGLNAPEDLALIARDPRTGQDWLAAAHHPSTGTRATSWGGISCQYIRRWQAAAR